MANYEVLKTSVEQNGEVLIRLDTGEKMELHKHNLRCMTPLTPDETKVIFLS